jgi:hypothetical protein
MARLEVRGTGSLVDASPGCPLQDSKKGGEMELKYFLSTTWHMQWKEVVDLRESFFLSSLRPRSLVSLQLFLETALGGILRRYSVY